MYNKKISIADLQELFDGILRINFFIKRKSDIIVRKAPLYALKSHLIFYLINAIKRNYYKSDEVENSNMKVSYEISGLQKQEGYGHTLVMLKFVIGDKIFRCHQILTGRLYTLLKNEVEGMEIISDYIPAPDDSYPDMTVNELADLWESIYNKMHELCWNVYHFIDTCTWANIMTSHYNDIKIRTTDNKWQNSSEGFIRRGNRKTGKKTPNVNFKYMRTHFTHMLRVYFNDEIIMNYSWKTYS